MLLLDKLWKGDIAPCEGRYHPSTEYSKAMGTMERCDDTLKAHLSEEDYRLFREYADATISTACIESCDNFIEGFRMGAKMMMDILADSNHS